MKALDLKNMEEKDILILAQSGNMEAVEFLLNKYKNFVKNTMCLSSSTITLKSQEK